MKLNILDFFKQIEQSFTNNVPFVMYRKPYEDEVFGSIQNSKELNELESFNQKGFVFCPFKSSEKSVLFPIEKCEQISANIKHLDSENRNSNYTMVSSSKSKNEYETLISATVEHIKTSEVEKIVISRKEIVEIENLDIILTYKNILNTYKSAFVYCWYHPKIGLWMGASPERLLQIDKGVFKTMALASTKKFNGTLDVNWGAKEVEEQQIVTDYILKNLQPIISNINISKPYTVKAGSLLHLRTDISSKVSLDNTVEKLVKELHPTPAVCGMPKNKAKEFILKNEGYNRSYYTGFLGELNYDNSTNLFVNLRCMEVDNKQVSIFVGGGITSQSIAEKEWDETIAKSVIMKQIL